MIVAGVCKGNGFSNKENCRIRTRI